MSRDECLVGSVPRGGDDLSKRLMAVIDTADPKIDEETPVLVDVR
jgi:hypothetical protein